MPVKSLAEIMEEMYREYRRSRREQRGWRMLAGTDEYGHSDIFFYGPRAGIWQVKGEVKSPHELIGAGAKVVARRIDDEIRELMDQGSPMPFGFLSPHPRSKNRAIIAAGIGRHSESIERLKKLLPSKQQRLDLELRLKLRELRREFGLDAAYG